MGILRRLREWREDKDGTLIGPDIEADSVNTDDANIGGNDWMAAGDVDWQLTLPSYNRDASTTSTTYTNTGFNHYLYRIIPANHISTNGTIAAYISANIKPGSGETVDVRLRDTTNNEVIVEKTNITSEGVISATSEWAPATPNSGTALFVEFRTNPGTNSVTIEHPITKLGVQL